MRGRKDVEQEEISRSKQVFSEIERFYSRK